MKKLGDEPGLRPLDEVLFPYWLRLEPRLVGFVLQGVKAGGFYRTNELPREGKAPRLLHEPHPVLKFMQRRILRRILDQVEVHPSAHGFVSKRSIFTNAAPHTRKRLVVAMDLRDFFPSISLPRVAGAFMAVGFSRKTACRLAGLCCYQGVLPQGAPTSPAISNLVCRRLDARLHGLMSSHGYAYTRYADDLTFSGDERLLRLLPRVRCIVAEEGFAEAPEKTRIMRSGSRQMVTGLTVNDRVAVPKRVRRLIRAMVHTQSVATELDDELVRFLYGHIGFMRPVHSSEARELHRKLAMAVHDDGL